MDVDEKVPPSLTPCRSVGPAPSTHLVLHPVNPTSEPSQVDNQFPPSLLFVPYNTQLRDGVDIRIYSSLLRLTITVSRIHMYPLPFRAHFYFSLMQDVNYLIIVISKFSMDSDTFLNQSSHDSNTLMLIFHSQLFNNHMVLGIFRGNSVYPANLEFGQFSFF